MFTIVFWITTIGFVTASAGIIAALPVIWEPTKKGRIKLNRRGYFFIGCSILLVILPVALYVFQSQSDRAEQTVRDAALRKSILDSIMLPEQPVLEVNDLLDGKGIRWMKLDNGLNHYSINLVSENGASCCYDLKISAVIVRSDSRLIYKGLVDVRLNKSDELAENDARRWTFTVNDSIPYDWFFLWVRGSYADRTGTHPYKMDQVYYNRKTAGTSGGAGNLNKPQVIDLVRRNEKIDSL